MQSICQCTLWSVERGLQLWQSVWDRISRGNLYWHYRLCYAINSKIRTGLSIDMEGVVRVSINVSPYHRNFAPQVFYLLFIVMILLP